ncbi:MAG: hypothetical protein HY731_01330, partial [Candidatus Tectomicrobia bacterium]|nr:hypothetical protein [Candidatus Tectomicrobia bacterium]
MAHYIMYPLALFIGLLLCHVWVEAYLPFAAYRGLSLAQAPKHWSPLDASFKLHRLQPGTDLLKQAGIDPIQAQAMLEQAVEIDPGGSVMAFQGAGVETLVRRVYDQVRAVTPAVSPLQDGRGRWNRVERRHGVLPAAIDLKVLRRDRRTSMLDSSLRHHLRVQ